MRRKRRTRYYWLPIYGTPNSGDPTIFSSAQQLQLTVAATSIVTGWSPIVVNDIPVQQGIESFPLNDIIGNEYIVKRIVGKCFVDVEYVDTLGRNQGTLPPIVAAGGFYVARRDTVANNFNPIDSAQADLFYSPLNAALQTEPWAWRRSWMLGPGAGGYPQNDGGGLSGVLVPTQTNNGTVITGSCAYPLTNTSYPGVLDGPHIDAKTGRRVRQDEALFFGFSAHAYPFASTAALQDLTVNVTFHLDVRVLGALRRTKNRSNF